MSHTLQGTGRVRGRVRIFHNSKTKQRTRAEFVVMCSEDSSYITAPTQSKGDINVRLHVGGELMEPIEWHLEQGDIVHFEGRLRFDEQNGGPIRNDQLEDEPVISIFQVDADVLAIVENMEFHVQRCMEYAKEHQWRNALKAARLAQQKGYRFSGSFMENLITGADYEAEMAQENAAFDYNGMAQEWGYENWGEFMESQPD